MAGNYYHPYIPSNRPYSPTNRPTFQPQFSPRRPGFSDPLRNPYQQDPSMFRTPSSLPPRPRYSPSSCSPVRTYQNNSRQMYQLGGSDGPFLVNTPPNCASPNDVNWNTPGYQNCSSPSFFGDGPEYCNRFSPGSHSHRGSGRSFSPRNALGTPRTGSHIKRPFQRGTDHNSGGSNSILAYYKPSMLEDPWKGLIPVEAGQGLTPSKQVKD